MALHRILILCTGLEPGGDGVGDYCRRLAAALTTLGIDCFLLALNDRRVGREVATDGSDGASPTLRLPEGMAVRDKAARVASVIAEQQPDWLSLDFVSYGFHAKGFVYREAGWLPQALSGRPLHLMVHETWISQGPFGTLKRSLVGATQAALVARLVRRLRPAVVQTSNAYYVRMLARHGIDADVLPLFGNIPVTGDAGEAWLYPALRAETGAELAHDRRRYWLFGLFGAIDPVWRTEPLFHRLEAVARRAGREIIVASAGHGGARSADLIQRWRADHPGMRFARLGPRTPREISQFLNTVDFGLMSRPIYLLGASGSTLAMLEHGLPVIATWGDIAPDLPAACAPLERLFWRDDAELETRLLEPLEPRQRRPDRPLRVAERMIARLGVAARG